MKIKFSRINFDSECYKDLLNGKGFIITEPPFSDADKSVRSANGPRSAKYGTTFGDTNEFMDRYRCNCGRFIGATFEGEVCPICESEVTYKDIDIMQTGYLDFSPFHLINPLYFHKLQSALSKKNLENIISNKNIITSNGILRRYNDDVEVKKSMLKYHNIGMDAFYKNFEEIMLYYRQKRKIKADLIDKLIEEKDMLWITKFPVYSTALRPQGITVESYFFSPIDKQIYPLTYITMNLKKATPIEVPLYLYQAQLRINKLWQLNFSLIDGKDGWIRSNVLGGCMNYTGQ